MKTKNGSLVYQVLSGRNNVHLIHSGDDWILVDTGMTRFYPKLKRRLQKILPAEASLTLFLTHTHFDHVQNANALKKDFNCRILVSKNEAAFIQKGKTPLPKGTNLFAKFMVGLGNLIAKTKTGFPPFEADETIEEDRELSSSARIIKTPGHTSGSFSLIIDEEFAFVGDVLFGVFKNSVLPPFADDIPLMIQSWGKLLESNCNWFFPGHGKKISRAFLEKNYKEKLKTYSAPL